MEEKRIFLHPDKIQRVRYNVFIDQMKKNKFNFVEKVVGNDWDVLVTEYKSFEELFSSLKKSFENRKELESKELVNTSWLSESLKARKLVPIQSQHRISRPNKSLASQRVETECDVASQQVCETEFSDYACQRRTPLNHKNKKLVTAFQVLARNAEFRFGVVGDQQYYARALAFDRVSALLKSLPEDIRSAQAVASFRHIGKHALRVIEEICNYGRCVEVEEIVGSHFHKTMELFTSVYGVGPSSANRWIQQGWSRLDDIGAADVPRNDARIKFGLAFHDDLVRRRVTKTESAWWQQRIQAKVGSAFSVTVTGGFRRGKSDGHDIDLLISPVAEDHTEKDLLKRLVSELLAEGVVLHGLYEADSFRPDVLQQDGKGTELRSQLDHFEKWLGIVKFPLLHAEEDKEEEKESGPTSAKRRKEAEFRANVAISDDLDALRAMAADPERQWLARRVDLVVVPPTQLAYALVGWTGNRHFNRDLRLYAQKELGMKLSSHGLFHPKTAQVLGARTEAEVFDHLRLPCLAPQERNC